VLDRVLEGEDTPLGLGLIADIGVLLPHPHHHTRVARTPDDTREDSPGRIIPGKTGLHRTQATLQGQCGESLATDLYEPMTRSSANLDHAGAIVTDKRLDVLAISHLVNDSAASHNTLVESLGGASLRRMLKVCLDG
jgi:hypothetical protein